LRVEDRHCRFDLSITFRSGFIRPIHHGSLLPAVHASAFAITRAHGVHSPPQPHGEIARAIGDIAHLPFEARTLNIHCLPFSFVSCLRVVGCSPLSPIAYCGLVDAEEIRGHIRHSLKAWFSASLERYPDWVRDAVVHNPAWIEARLSKNPQWINEQIKRMSVQGDLFA
jgi:hypothetical protein